MRIGHRKCRTAVGRVAILGSVAASLLCTPAGASVDDPFWFAPAAPAAPLRLSLDGEAVAGTVEHAPNRADGGHEPVSRLPRYVGAGVSLDWRPSSAWSLRAALKRRALASMRDRYTIAGAALGAARALPSPHAATRLAVVVDYRANRAAELHKNSWTHLGEATLTEARLLDARDDTLGLALASRTRLGRSIGLSALLGAGLTRSAHDRLRGTGDDGDGCRYGFDAADGGGTLELLEPCEELVAFREEYANERGVERRLGLAPSADLAYTARTARIGLGVDAVLGRFDVALAWTYTRHVRTNVDERIRERGARSVTSSHVTSLRTGVAVTRRLRLVSGLHYRSTAYLDELPLLYGAFTAERFRRNTLSLGAGLSYAF